VSQFGRRESARSCSPMMAGDGGAWVGTREEEGCPVAGAGEAVEKDGSSSSGVDAEQSGVRRRWLPQNGGRAGENMRGKWGGGVDSSVPRGGGIKREGGGWVGSQTTVLEWLWAARSVVAVRAHGGGGLTNSGGRHGAGDAVGMADE
jgi:hypothetical protein